MITKEVSPDVWVQVIDAETIRISWEHVWNDSEAVYGICIGDIKLFFIGTCNRFLHALTHEHSILLNDVSEDELINISIMAYRADGSPYDTGNRRKILTTTFRLSDHLNDPCIFEGMNETVH